MDGLASNQDTGCMFFDNYTPDFHVPYYFCWGVHISIIFLAQKTRPLWHGFTVHQAPKATENEFPAAPTQQVHFSAGPVVDSGAEDATGHFGISFKDI